MVLVALLGLPAVAQARGLTTGFLAPAAHFDEASDSGAGMVRVNVSWAGVAPSRPAAADDPADPIYRWDATDAAVADATTHGLRVMLSFTGAPKWAQQGKAPSGVAAGSYRPDPDAVGDFATALARRYAGTVRHIQVWNEPNLSRYISPQWEGGSPFAAQRYRAMLNAAYPGVHATGARLVTAGTAPYGDPGRDGERIRPVIFWRAVLRRDVRFDILSHHPYSAYGPRRSAVSSKDVAVPDVHRLVSLVRRATRRGIVLPHRRKHFWVTELAWDSNPPDPDGVPERKQARWLADAFFVLWKQRVDHVFWLQIRDQPPEPSYSASLQGGVYFRDGTPKRSQRAFAFPFSCEKHGRHRTRVWVKAPSRARITIKRRGGRTVRRLSPGRDRVATATVRGRARLHAVSGDEKSLSCRA